MAAVLLAIGTAPELARSSPDAGAPSAGVETLPELPKAPPLGLPDPKPEDLERVDELLARLRSPDPGVRDTAVRETLEVSQKLVPALAHRLRIVADEADKGAMKETLQAIRTKARDAVRKQMRARGETGDVETPDYLSMATAAARPGDKSWQQLVTVLGISRMLRNVGTVEAARQLVEIYVRFGEFLRVDTQLQLEQLGDRAVAALVEARRHPAEKIGRWAARQLDTLGKAIPSEVVQTEDHQVLADVLRAYGRVRDPDAARIVISFANSERAQVRTAARQAVALLGEVGGWQLRDSYENVVGKKPPRDWTWERTARQLFAEFDRMRLSKVFELFDAGRRARKSSDLVAMKAAYDKALAHSPLLDQAAEVGAGYLEFAQRYASETPDVALDAARRAERLLADDDQRKLAGSLALLLQAQELLETGVADRTLLDRALELDPQNRAAAALLARLERGELDQRTEQVRYGAAGSIAAAALLAIGVILLRRPKREKAPLPAPDAREDAS